MRFSGPVIGTFATCLMVAAPAAAQTYERVHAFQAPLANAKAQMIVASDGTMYGVYASGGAGGVGGIFAVQPQADGSVMATTVHEFQRSEGGGVLDALMEAPDGWLYGVAPEHGANGLGTIFKFHRVTRAFTVLHAFAGSDGARPRGPLVAGHDGNYYGVTTGSPRGMGTVFKLTSAGVVTTLHEFTDGIASGLLVQASDGHLYGTNGAHIFRLTLGGTRTILHTLLGQLPLNVPPVPTGLVEGADGHLYGVLANQPIGLHFFRMTFEGAFSMIYSSNFGQLEEGLPGFNTPLSASRDGSVLGTMPFGGVLGQGTVFRLTNTGTFTVLHALTPAEGRAYSGIVRHPNGLYYGTTLEAGFTGLGTIYSTSLGPSLQVRHTFVSVHPNAPSAPPVDGPDGAMYGTTIAGGLFNRGTVYRLTSSGVTVLHHFFGLDGAHPMGQLVLGPDGVFYGTTYAGGVQNRGTVFRISPTGSFRQLHTFTAPNGRNPTSGLVRAADGNYWGTTLRGGSADAGTVFKITPAGMVTPVHSFVLDFFADRTMVHPYAALIQAQDGNLYGTTYGSDANSAGGAVFRIAPSGTLTRLHQFPHGTSGPRILASLVQGSDGALYGAACCGGSLSGAPPQVFQLTTSGVLTTLQILDGAALSAGSDGAFYGATVSGTLFRIESNGTFDEVKTLTEPEGIFPSGVRTAGEWIMGSAYGGGPAGGGVIFRFKRD